MALNTAATQGGMSGAASTGVLPTTVPAADRKVHGMRGKLSGMQIAGKATEPKAHKSNFYAFASPPVALNVNGATAGGGTGVHHGSVSNGGRRGIDTAASAAAGGASTNADHPPASAYKKGSGKVGGGDGAAMTLSRRYGSPATNNARTSERINSEASTIGGSTSTGDPVSADRRRGAPPRPNSMNGGSGVSGVPPRGRYDGAEATPVGGGVNEGSSQPAHVSFSAGASAPTAAPAGIQQRAATTANAEGDTTLNSAGVGAGVHMPPPTVVGMQQGVGAGNSTQGGGMGNHMGHTDSSQHAVVGQYQSGVYYGNNNGGYGSSSSGGGSYGGTGGGYGGGSGSYGGGSGSGSYGGGSGSYGGGSSSYGGGSGGYGGGSTAYGGGVTPQGGGSGVGLSAMGQATGAYSTSSGHSVGYSHQMGGMDMQQGLAGYPVGAGGVMTNMGVLPGATGIQSPYGAYWPSGGELSGYGGIPNGLSTYGAPGGGAGPGGAPAAGSYGAGYGAGDGSLRDAGSGVGSAAKSPAHQPHYHVPAHLGVDGSGVGLGAQRMGDPYGVRQSEPYDATRGYHTRQHPYGLSPVGNAAGAYGVGAYNYGYGYGVVSPKVGFNRDRRGVAGRGRTGGVASGFAAPESQRESDLSVATDNLTLEEIDGNVFRMSKDQIGCRLLQMKLDQGDPVFVEKICSEAKPYLAEMMKDPFGNYLFQKIADKVDEAERTDLVNKVMDDMVAAGMNLHGTRSVQKVIEVCRGTPPQVTLVVDALKPATVTLCLDTNGNHVVQRLLQHLDPKDNDFVFEMLADACVRVATHRHGCCVLQRALDAATVEQSRLLISQVCKHALQLMQDPYGNYVVQYVLGICTREEADALVNVPLGKVAMLSMQKFSSNVIEKCMDRASEEVIVKYVRELADPAAMRPLLQDQYANYVIQKTLQLAPRDAALSLVESIREHLNLMRNSSGGRRMLTKIAKRFPEVHLGVDAQRPVSGPP